MYNFAFQVCQAQPGHFLIHCIRFKEMTPKQRHKTIQDLRRCFMCFSEHLASQCKSTRVCGQCSGRHHTWLHLSARNDTAGEDWPTGEESTYQLKFEITVPVCFWQLLRSWYKIIMDSLDRYVHC